MDDPHYVTVVEAQKKLCPMTMNRKVGSDLCISSDCMAWRWGPSYKWNEDEDKPEVIYSTTHGYCGMVRS